MLRPQTELQDVAPAPPSLGQDALVAAPAPYPVKPEYVIDLDESGLSWDLSQAGNRASAASALLDKARNGKILHIVSAVVLVVSWVADNVLPYDLSLVWMAATAGLFLARIAFVHCLSRAALICADSVRGISDRLIQVVVAFLVPFYNFVMPFRIMRRLADASTTLDLPRVRVVQELPETGTYRSMPKRVVVNRTPRAPTAPMLIVWQLLFIAAFFARLRGAAAAITAICLAYEAFVFHRIYERFRARVRHLQAIARAIVPER